MLKTNKSYAKRLKVTKNGKILNIGAGHNHFNAKESRKNQYRKNRMQNFLITNKTRSRYLVNL